MEKREYKTSLTNFLSDDDGKIIFTYGAEDLDKEVKKEEKKLNNKLKEEKKTKKRQYNLYCFFN
jgi:hypothetical protein